MFGTTQNGKYHLGFDLVWPFGLGAYELGCAQNSNSVTTETESCWWMPHK